MALSAFYDEMGRLGASIANEFGKEMGISATFSHRSGTPTSLYGFVRGTQVTKELVLKIMTGGERIPFFFGKQTDSAGHVFPPTDGIALFDEVIWTPPVTGSAIRLVVEEFEDIASMGQMFRLKCYFPSARQLGAVG